MDQKPQADFLLMDGNSIVNRAYYGMGQNRLTAPDGTPTGATYVFFNMLFSYLKKLDVKRTLVCFDRPGKTFRHELFEEYKAGRKAMDEDLAIQFPLIKEGLRLLGIRCLEKNGFEADDLVASLATRAAAEDKQVFVLSGDRDLWQLISDRITLIYPYNRKGERGRDLMTPQVFYDLYGFQPEQLLDYKALKGDSSDNIPGVPGVGQKTATALLQEYGSLENIYQHLNEVKPAWRKKLEAGEEQANLSYTLAKLKKDVPLTEAEIQDIADMDRPGLAAFFNKLNIQAFHDLLDLDTGQAKFTSDAVNRFHLIQDPALLLTDKTAMYAWDAGAKLALADTSGQLYLAAGPALQKLWSDLLSQERELVLWQGKHLLRKYDLEIPAYDYFDEEIAAYLLNLLPVKQNMLDQVSEVYFALTTRKPDREPATEETVAFALQAMKPLLEDRLEAENMTALAADVEFPLARILAAMERRGIKVDPDHVEQLSTDMAQQLATVEKQIFELLGEEININSSKQLGEKLFADLKLPGAKKTKSGAYSTAADVLEPLALVHPVIPLILDFREMSKLKSTFVDGLGKEIAADGRIHTHFNQTLTSTGRLSSNAPNLQNIPVKSEQASAIRNLFVADPGYCFVDADYSQIELRLLAVLSGDENLLAAFESGEDVHTATAARFFAKPVEAVTPLERRAAKTVNYSIIYGISEFGLARNLQIDRQEAKQLIDAYDQHYPKVRSWMREQVDFAYREGYVKTLLGRRRYIPELKSKNFHTRSFGERAAMNAPVQGSAADLIKLAMLKVTNMLAAAGLKSRLLLQVHDELFLECPVAEADRAVRILREAMEEAMDMPLPLSVEVSVGERWGDMTVLS